MTIGISRAKLLIGVVLVLLISLPVIAPVFAADEVTVKVQTLRQAGKQLLDVGYEQYKRGMYDGARQTLGKAAQYRQYLSIADASKLDELLKKLHAQPGQSVQAPVIVEHQVVEKQFVEHQVVEKQVVDQQVVEETTSTQPGVDTEYIEFAPVEPADIEAAGQSPIVVEEIEILPEYISPAPALEQEYQVETYQPAQAPVMEGAKQDYIEVVKQKRSIQQSYIKAVVNEAIENAKAYIAGEDFVKAKDEIARAQSAVEKNRLLLGDTDYEQYKASLQQLLDEMDARQIEVERRNVETAKAEAQATQEMLRNQQSADRARRISDLMKHSAEYQEQQRYEEALAQIETLLAIEPTNREAKRTKQMLEDIINLRRQLEVKKEIGREEQNILYENQRSMIPHADLMTYPRNWQDIAAKRKPTMITGLSEADAAVYEQLNSLVDLTALTPDMPFDEAIETIKISVEPPLKIVVRWKDLEENAYIEPDTLSGMQGLAGIPLGKALKELLSTVSGGITDIDFAIEEGIITIATAESLPPKLVTHVYDITELVGIPANYETDLQTGESASGSSGGTQESDQEIEGAELTIPLVMEMIQNTIAPMSWLINGGEGTISNHGRRLVINQTPQIHEQIQKLLLEDLRESLGQQVSIEARFLFVTENFLEDIGLGIDQIYVPQGKIHDNISSLLFDFDTAAHTRPTDTSISGNLVKNVTDPTAVVASLLGGGLYGGLGGAVLDDLAVSFFLRATQAHSDARVLTAPRVTVLSGESAYMRVITEHSYVSDYEFEDITATGTDASSSVVRVAADVTIDITADGVVLNVTPTITADKKYVILQIGTSFTKAALDPYTVTDTQGYEYPISLPTRQVSELQTRVSVPDGGTLLIGGQKLGAEVNKESGVPVVSKVPLLGRLFSTRSQVKDQDVLLVLVKPAIILQQESEREYFAPLE
ncbi:MAG: hypothetical protein JW806_05800 [Sedimentisphaerales bacterium]|nr:hypothetical protein [Sedimentisphaerales bacterium]